LAKKGLFQAPNGPLRPSIQIKLLIADKLFEARNVAIYLMRKYTVAPLKDIGSRFGMSSYRSISSYYTNKAGDG
jgi:hypothetical protein